MGKKSRTFAIGDTVTIPTIVWKKGEPRTVRRKGIIRAINNGTARVIFRTGSKSGMFAHVAIADCKRTRTAPRKVYAFGQVVGDA